MIHFVDNRIVWSRTWDLDGIIQQPLDSVKALDHILLSILYARNARWPYQRVFDPEHFFTAISTPLQCVGFWF